MDAYSVLIAAKLSETKYGGMRIAVEPGHRSMLFVFDRLGEEGEQVYLGAVYNEILVGGAPGEALRAGVSFWEDLAEIYATQGAKFDLWYAGNKVGYGEVVSVR